jgi:hypothetical protein
MPQEPVYEPAGDEYDPELELLADEPLDPFAQEGWVDAEPDDPHEDLRQVDPRGAEVPLDRGPPALLPRAGVPSRGGAPSSMEGGSGTSASSHQVLSTPLSRQWQWRVRPVVEGA